MRLRERRARAEAELARFESSQGDAPLLTLEQLALLHRPVSQWSGAGSGRGLTWITM